MKTQNWEGGHSYIFYHFGKTSVVLFFMITSFLFFSKLIDNHTKKVDWVHFFISRIMRLYPLYIIVLLIMLIYIGILSNFKLKESLIKLSYEVGNWFLFKIFADTPINGVSNPTRITAGVLWSLAYEWFFYLVLPIIGLIFFKIRTSLSTILIVLTLAILIFIQKDFKTIHLFSFLGGIVAAFLVRQVGILKFATTKFASLIVLTCFSITITFYPIVNTFVPMLLISLAFILIACGNSIFGILTRIASRTLGQMSYTIYLLHGIILFFIFRLCIGFENAKEITLIQHWAIIGGIATFPLLLCFSAYKYIEFPAMKSASKMSSKINNLLGSIKVFKKKPLVIK